VTGEGRFSLVLIKDGLKSGDDLRRSAGFLSKVIKHVAMPIASVPALHLNVADRLADVAGQMPDAVAVAHSNRGGFATCTFGELDDDAAAIARGLVEMGVKPAARMVLLVKPGVEFVKLVFGLLRRGAVTVLVDPGMGRRHLVKCLVAAEPDGFVAISQAQAVRTLLRRRFPRARHNVTLGRRWFWGGHTYKQLLKRGRKSSATLPPTHAEDAAAIIFTSGSTGPPKGVLYTHGMFDAQASEIGRAYDLRPGGVDLACFALFGLFNSAMGATTVFPDMDFSRPASADPRKLLAAANDWKVTQGFASPAVWDKLSRYCEATGERIPTLRKVFSCGAPVPAKILERTLAMVHPDAEMHTPYGATEALPVATIEAREVLNETAPRTAQGAGVCVGRKFDSIEWRVIRITDDPIATIDDAEELPVGEIGELIVRGPQVSPAYVIALQPRALPGGRSQLQSGLALHANPRAEPEAEFANLLAKIRDGDAVWHRMGDVGYLDERGRFWYCGRKSQRVDTSAGTLFPECCEALFNDDSHVRRTALVGIGRRGHQTPVIIVEPLGPAEAKNSMGTLLFDLAQRHEQTRQIRHFLMHDQFPVDVRHNSKINREQLAEWAGRTLKVAEPSC